MLYILGSLFAILSILAIEVPDDTGRQGARSGKRRGGVCAHESSAVALNFHPGHRAKEQEAADPGVQVRATCSFEARRSGNLRMSRLFH